VDGFVAPEDDWSPVLDDSVPVQPPEDDSFPDEYSAVLQASTRLPADDSPDGWVQVPRRAADFQDDSASAALPGDDSLRDDSFLACYSADSPLAECSAPDWEQAHSDARSVDFPDAIGSPEFPEQLPDAERSREDVPWSRSRVFPEALLSPPDAPQPPRDASPQLHASAKAAPGAPPLPVASAQMKPEAEAAFSSQPPAGWPLLRVGQRRDRQSKLSLLTQPDVSEPLRLFRSPARTGSAPRSPLPTLSRPAARWQTRSAEPPSLRLAHCDWRK
jgi:hypothetical protein